MVRNANGLTGRKHAIPHDGADATLIARVRDGDTEAFGRLVDRYEGALARYARHVLGGGDDAADALQDALVRAYQALDRCDPDQFEGWLFRIVSNVCRSRLARRRRHPMIPLDQVADQLTTDDNPERAVEHQEMSQQLHEALRALTLDHREALVMHYVQGLSVHAIAEALDCSLSAVKMRLKRGRESLRGVLEGSGP